MERALGQGRVVEGKLWGCGEKGKVECVGQCKNRS